MPKDQKPRSTKQPRDQFHKVKKSGQKSGFIKKGADKAPKNVQEEQKQARPAFGKKKTESTEILEKATALWEKARPRKIAADKKKGMMKELFEMLRGHVREFASKKDGCRLLEAIALRGTHEQRQLLIDELKGSIVDVSCTTFGRHVIEFLVRHGNRRLHEVVYSEILPRARMMLTHKEAIHVLDLLYVVALNSTQKHTVFASIYGPSYALLRRAVLPNHKKPETVKQEETDEQPAAKKKKTESGSAPEPAGDFLDEAARKALLSSMEVLVDKVITKNLVAAFHISHALLLEFVTLAGAGKPPKAGEDKEKDGEAEEEEPEEAPVVEDKKKDKKGKDKKKRSREEAEESEETEQPEEEGEEGEESSKKKKEAVEIDLVGVREVRSVLANQIGGFLHTYHGALLAMNILGFGSAKDRRAAVKSIKGSVNTVCCDEYGHLFVCKAFDCVDDTDLLTKSLVHEMSADLSNLMTSPYGRKVLIRVLTPDQSKSDALFPVDQRKALGLTLAPQLEDGQMKMLPTTKKAFSVRREAVLKNLAPSIIKTSISHIAPLLHSNHAPSVLLAALQYLPNSEEKSNLLSTVIRTALTAHKGGESEEKPAKKDFSKHFVMPGEEEEETATHEAALETFTQLSTVGWLIKHLIVAENNKEIENVSSQVWEAMQKEEMSFWVNHGAGLVLAALLKTSLEKKVKKELKPIHKLIKESEDKIVSLLAADLKLK